MRRATTLFVKHSSISEVSKRIAQSVDESLSKQQKEFFLRQQLAAIQRELQDLRKTPNSMTNDAGSRPGSPASELDDENAEVEDMADIRTKIEAMAKDSEERKMAVREWRRLKRIPQGSVEHGVIRSYVCALSYSCISLELTQSAFVAARMAHSDSLAELIYDDPFQRAGDSA